MQKKAFTLLHDMEGSWWYRGRAAVVTAALRTTIGKAGVREALDFGAGFGGMAARLMRTAQKVYAFEPDADASAQARTRGYAKVFTTVEESLAKQYDLIGLFDVVEHIEHDQTFIAEMKTALEPGGHVAITVPAFPFLWSVHDVSHHHYRRYTKASMRALLAEHGFEIRFMSYWNMTLFIPAALMRLIGRSSGESALGLPQPVDDLFFTLVYIESLLMRLLPLPFGTGLVVIARKK